MNESTWAAPSSDEDVAIQVPSNDWSTVMNLEMRSTSINPVETSEEPASALPLSSSSSDLAALPALHTNQGPSPSLPLASRRRASQGSTRQTPSPVSRFLQKATTPLQLPSFERLGISTSQPLPTSSPRARSTDRSSHRSHSSFVLNPSSNTQTVHSRPYSACEIRNGLSPPGEYGLGLPLTPPADDDDKHISWNPTSNLPAVHVDRVSSEYPSEAPPDESKSCKRSSSSGDPRGDSSNSGTMQADVSSNPDSIMQRLQSRQNHREADYLADGIETTISSLAQSRAAGEPVRLVSHTLPFPRSPNQDIRQSTSNTVFGCIVEAIQNRLQPGQSPYINITHAVPEQFALSNLPTSPASTPGLQAHGDDYFSSTVFSSATPVPSYHDFRGADESKQHPSIIVPPRSVHVSILERYLPPSSGQEFRDLFDHKRPSPLVDRLFELSAHGGSLLFIYPTKRGATTFKTQYLGPILDPLLRHMVVLRGLSADVGRDLGKLAAVSEMDDFETMQRKVQQLCQDLSTTDSRFILFNSGVANVSLDRSLWADWYLDQERPRMKELLSLFWQNSRRTSGGTAGFSTTGMVTEKELSSSSLLREIDEGLRKRQYGDDNFPREGIELGVFVIKRSG